MPYLAPGAIQRVAVACSLTLALASRVLAGGANGGEAQSWLVDRTALFGGAGGAQEPAVEPATVELVTVEPAGPVGPPLELVPPPHATQLDDLVVAGQYWRLDTPRGPVHVWAPRGYDPRTAAAIVFVHGYNADVDLMWSGARLPQQFALSGINALFIVPEAPSAKLAPMTWPSLNLLLQTVAAGTHEPMPRGKLVAIGHSGAYRTVVLWLTNEALSTIVLLDAAYGELDRFAIWANTGRHRLINIADETQPLCELMHRSIPATKRFEGLPATGFPDDVRRSRVLYVRTDVGHWPLVTGGVALPLALRSLDVPLVRDAPVELPLGFEP
jgi:hypothetical protein